MAISKPLSQMIEKLDLFIFAGETSGDLYGAKLIKEILKLNPHLQISAVSGPNMRKLKIKELIPMEEFQTIGFIDVLLALPKLLYKFFKLRRILLKKQPKVALFIDYPGFNLRLERSLRKKFQGKLIHYISPTVWAWGKKRIKTMSKNLDLLLTIFPFEKKYFSNTPLNVQYVGHPLVDLVNNPSENSNLQGFQVGIFPGSRHKEIKRNLPIQLKVLQRLTEKNRNLQPIISVTHNNLKPLIKKLIQKYFFHNLTLIDSSYNYDIMKKISFAIATSGTINLELALHLVPTIVTYKINLLDLFIVRSILKINLPFYCIVNIIAKKEVYPELYGPKLSEENLFSLATRLLTNRSNRTRCIEGCLLVKNKLSKSQTNTKAAQQIISLISS